MSSKTSHTGLLPLNATLQEARTYFLGLLKSLEAKQGRRPRRNALTR